MAGALHLIIRSLPELFHHIHGTLTLSYLTTDVVSGGELDLLEIDFPPVDGLRKMEVDTDQRGAICRS